MRCRRNQNGACLVDLLDCRHASRPGADTEADKSASGVVGLSAGRACRFGCVWCFDGLDEGQEGRQTHGKLMHAHVDLPCDSILLSLSLLPCSRAMRVMAAVFRLKDPLHLPESSFKLCSASSIYLPAVCMSLHRQLIKIQVFRLVSLSFRKRRVVWCAARPVLTALTWCSLLVSEWHTLLSILQALHVLPRPRSNAPFQIVLSQSARRGTRRWVEVVPPTWLEWRTDANRGHKRTFPRIWIFEAWKEICEGLNQGSKCAW
ncbi:hypothetical protein IWZ01DRAFT_494379 [Phyllosticta capitalensis]